MATRITLRQKPISGNRQSLYLDFYPPIHHPDTGQLTRREFLNLFLYDETQIKQEKYIDEKGKEQRRYVPVLDRNGNPKKVKLSAIDKQHNKDTLRIADQVRAKKDKILNGLEELNDLERRMLDKEKLQRERDEKSFIDYFYALAEKRKASNHDNWISAHRYLVAFAKSKLRFVDITETVCNDFKDYLLTVKSNKSTKAPISQNTASAYFNKFKAALKQAYKDGFLTVDLNVRISRIEANETIKQTLTLEELNILAKTDCKNPLLKKAVLFSALTGMPFKEMQNLNWGQIESSETFGIRIKMTRQKTGKPYLINISQQAFGLLGDRKDSSEQVFEKLSDHDRYYYFHLWLAEAGIKKDITFHDLRHTYGCLQIDMGTDIYTLQGNMGHSTPRQSMMYGKISDQRKREAADKIKLDF